MAQQDKRYRLDNGDALDFYAEWEAPTVIVSDGAYGVGGFPGDPRSPAGLVEWYRPHVEAWSKFVKPSTTLWFWNTEVGWATVHPLLLEQGWKYETLNIWDKGIGQIAGNVNSKTIRRFPVVTEACALYTRPPVFQLHEASDGVVSAQEWLRAEWLRTGLPLSQANAACGVKNAATRKYLTLDEEWYFPPVEVLEKLVSWANTHGDPAGRPYFSLDNGDDPTEDDETTWEKLWQDQKGRWNKLRSVWNHEHGVTNVWHRPSLRGAERFKGSGVKSAPRATSTGRLASTHLNQKPLDLMERIIAASSNPGDIVWEPFGGLASASVAALRLGRRACAAEPNEGFFKLAQQRLELESSTLFDVDTAAR